METMKSQAARDILAASRLGVLCLSEDDRSYGIPLFYNFDGEAIYFHCHPGMKDEFLASHKQACLVVMHLESESVWESVQVFGRVTKLTLNTDIDAAKAALYQVPFPPAEGHFSSGRPVRSEEGVYYARLDIEQIFGKASGYAE